MKQFVETRLVSLIQESIQRNVSVSEWEHSYELLAKTIFEANAAYEKTALHNSLCYAKVEFSFLHAQNGMQKNKMMLLHIEKAMCLIDTHLDFTERFMLSQYNNANTEESYSEKIKWLGTPTELVELVYALLEAGCFGKVALKTAFSYIGKVFDCEILNHSRLFWDIKNRASEDRTYFLNKLKKGLSKKLFSMEI
jgi:hypothetical protein